MADGAGAPRLKVVELGSWLAAPGAAALLADLPADVVKIEAATGDPGRDFLGAMGSDKTSPTFSLLNRGKDSVVLDLTEAGGRAALDALLADADIFITNLRQGSLQRLLLDPDRVMERFPRLVYASITGLGLRGPESESGVFDVGGFWARSGLMHQMIVPGGTPPVPAGGYGDMTMALAAYAGIVSALLRREWSGKGGLVETSLLQTGAYVMAGDLAVQAVHGSLGGQQPRADCRTPLVNSYQASDGRWLFLTEIDARRGIIRLAKAIGRPDMASDPRFQTSRLIRQNRGILILLLDEIFAARPLAELQASFAREGVLWQRVASPEEVLADPQLRENAMTGPICDGDEIVSMVPSPFTIDRRPRAVMHAPRIGEKQSAHPGGTLKQ